MAIAVDASSPARWSGQITPNNVITSAPFTAPANSLLVVCANYDSDGSPGQNVTGSCEDSGGLAWTERVRRDNNETTAGGMSVIFTAPQVTSASRTVSVRWTAGANGSPPKQMSAVCYVLTGVDLSGTPVDAVGANNEGGSGTNNLTTSSVTPGANGLLIACDTEWNARGSFEGSSDLTQNTTTFAGLMSVCSGYKAVSSGVAATANLNAAGTSAAQHKWCQIVVREAAGGGGTFHPGLLTSLGAGRGGYTA